LDGERGELLEAETCVGSHRSRDRLVSGVPVADDDDDEYCSFEREDSVSREEASPSCDAG